MPPIRTAKNNKSSGGQAPADQLPKRPWLRWTPKGEKEARFDSSERDWDGQYDKVIGTSTRSIIFDYEFLLTDTHIDDILSLGSPVCKNIVQFIFFYWDTAKHDARAVTNEAVVRLAKACPKLKRVHLPTTLCVTDAGLLGLLENCPNLTSVELTGTSRETRDKFTGSALDQLREHPEWVPKLKELILGESEKNKVFMKAMRSLGKERPWLTITLLRRSEVGKRGGDWEMHEWKKRYKKGRRIQDSIY